VAKQVWKERALAAEKELVDIYKLTIIAFDDCEITPSRRRFGYSTNTAPRLACEPCCDLVYQIRGRMERRLGALEAADLIRLTLGTMPEGKIE